MSSLILPPGVRYSCIRCGACCRTLEVLLTEAERERLAAHDWAAEVPGYSVQGFFARLRKARGKLLWRLRPRRDGACPFLAEDNLCRVHARLGYAAKPFAGRLFPFTFLVTPVGTFVGVRFSCPAVVRGEGRDLEEQRGELRRLFDEYSRTYDPPQEPQQVRFLGRFKLAWRDVLRIEDQLIAFLLMPDLDLPRRVLACLGLVRQFVAQAVRGGAGERVGVDPNAAVAEARGGGDGERLSRIERLMLRLGIAAFLGATPASYRELALPSRIGVRMGNLWRRLKMAFGIGRVRLPGMERAVRLREVGSLGPASLDAASTAMLQRYLIAKVSSQGFFGGAFFRWSFAQGFEFLAMACVGILWLASAHAVASGRRDIQAADIEYGIRQVDHGYNYLREFGGLAARARSLLLWHWGTVGKALRGLCASSPSQG